MAKGLVRRDVLRGLAVFTAVAGSLGALGGCAEDEPAGRSTEPADQARVYPQGVASGDPKPDSVILWTRVASADGGAVEVDYEVATDAAFTAMVTTGKLSATAESDHTVRLKLSLLEAYTTYHYRFIADGVVSVIGRTKTAPAADQDVSPRFAFASCQDFNGRYFHAYRTLVREEPDLDFILHLGDYIYETEGDPRFQDPTDARKVTLPDGLPVGSADAPFNAALTLADYRSLYKQYRSDADLQEAHRLFPFINIWDDHEFADDAWQDHATHFNDAKGDEKDTDRRMAASRAWYEFQPADVPYDAAATFPADLTIYRALRYGKHVELFLTDQRSYRDDHVIPEGPIDVDVAKLGENTSLGARAFVLKKGFDPKEAAVAPTMLGDDQKGWFLDGVKQSKATWKFWCSETQLAQMVVNLKDTEVPDTYKDLFYVTLDQWDGYRTERAAILSELSGTKNIVVLTGDIHAFYASELHVDFDAPKAVPVAVEYVVAGIASKSFEEIVESVISGDEVLSSLGLLALVPQLDTLFQDAGAHYRYAKSRANGVALVEVDGDKEIKVSFLELKSDLLDPKGSGELARTEFRTANGANTIEPVT
ncbi:MAG: alkaline phosphatase [Myxococcales bacterium]|nr:alkaline phosphatase [Myxococcales bacterium]